MDWSRGFQVFSSATHDGLWLDEGVEELRLEKTVTSPQKVCVCVCVHATLFLSAPVVLMCAVFPPSVADPRRN